MQIYWFRQDLRLFDNIALLNAFKSEKPMLLLYILDEENFRPIGNAQKWWLHYSLTQLSKSIKILGGKLFIYKGCSIKILKEIIKNNNIEAIYFNKVFEPEQLTLDLKLEKILYKEDIDLKSYNYNLTNHPEKIVNKKGEFYKVFTSFYKEAVKYINNNKLQKAPSRLISPKRITPKGVKITELKLCPKKPNWAKDFTKYCTPGEAGAQKTLKDFIDNKLINYKTGRDFPISNSTSRLSAHIHFGEISLNHIVQAAENQTIANSSFTSNVECFIKELFWREFSYYLLYHLKKLPKKNFNTKFDKFPWKYSKVKLKAWQNGNTGYPIVDAGMRELWSTGYMHNRVRMIVASFLTKHLLIHWKYGEKWFWDTLLDADVANNAASWQWVQGCGADAAPYFRIFNPIIQGEKFDSEGKYIRNWIPELAKLPNKYIHKPWLAPKKVLIETNITLGKTYPFPIVEHTDARELALSSFKKI